MLGELNHRLEKGLYKRGFTSSEVRRLVMAQLYVCAVSVLFALGAGWAFAWPWHFAAGALLSTFNFYHLARFVQRIVYVTDRPVAKGLVRYYGRLAVTGAVLYFLIAWAHVSVAALVAGLSTVVAILLVWGLTRIKGQKVKEA
ncbi:MAG: ATP synthase subunit I [Desulfovibrionaceae bacterium]|jgi:hypothetical protein|nr:ATP synthase subunit I [Desulfovibrionaceae bacterium]